MKNLMVRTHMFTMLTSRLVAIVLFAALLSAVPFHAAFAAKTAPALGSASNFAVLSAASNVGGAVTLTNSTVTGDVGSSGLPASVVQTDSRLRGRSSRRFPLRFYVTSTARTMRSRSHRATKS